MSEMNPFTPKDEEHHGESNVFLDLNKADEATGVPSVAPGAGQQGGFAAAEPSRFNGQVMLAGLVFAVGVGSIYAMRYIGMQAGIKESVKMVEYTASTTNPDFVKRFDGIMESLEEVSYAVQFDKTVTLPSEPFTMKYAGLEEDDILRPQIDPVDPNAKMQRLAQQRAEQARLDKMQTEQGYEDLASDLKLQSLIGGTRPVARISGEPVGVGMTVADTFKVISIKGSVVTLAVEDMRFELALGEPAKRIK